LELIKSNPNLLLINDRANAQEIFERVNKLERRLEAALNKSESISYWGTIIVILIISLSIIGLTF
jgi:hypothetical protein